MKLSSLIGQTLDEKYCIDKQLGKGGMGAVFLATHLGTGRPVAVKVIAPQFMTNDEFVERFRREAKAAGRLRHPNVVNVTDFGFANFNAHRLAYLVMEYLDGCSLGDILAEETRLPLEWVVDILEQVCSAVDEAHKQGIVHRDLKPDNIWLEPNRRGGYTVKVLDFGLAKLGDPTTPELEEGFATSASQISAPATEVAEATAQSDTQIIPTAGATQLIETATPTQLAAVASEEVQTRILPASEEAPTHIIHQAAEARTHHQAAADGSTQVQRLEEAPARQPMIEEEATRIMPNPVAQEDETRILTQPATSEEAPHLLVEQSYEAPQSYSFDSADGLTRVGSVLGTPLYMSPEQCSSQPLDARADIYSLGVIAYQMLTGVTPFSGDMATVMKHHVSTPPPSFKEVQIDRQPRKRKYKIPPRTQEVILSALAKNPNDRPASAASFANSLQASSEGVGALLRRAFALYSEYFPKFFMASVIVNIPGIMLFVLRLLNTILLKTNVIGKFSAVITDVIFFLLRFVLSFLAASVLSGVTVWMVTHLMLTPLRPVRVRKAFAAVKRKLRPVITTTLLFIVMIMLGFILLFFPMLIVMITYALTMPVVMMENLSGWKAMKRAKALAKRSKRTVIYIVLIQVGIHSLWAVIISGLIALYGKAYPQVIDNNIAKLIADFLRIPIDLLVVPLISIMTGLLYLKMRLAGGEDLNATLSQFEDADAPQTNWQKRMRERLSLLTHTSK
ncbi:MAG: protein kinase [Acidobacteria bacterium]|nr:protein kinase [Acidobacteriota bacterium]